MTAAKHILLATDFRPAARQAADVAVELAWALGSRIHLLHVVEPIPSWPVSEHQQREWAVGLLADLRDKLTERNVAIGEPAVEVGPVASTIVHHAESVDADLILIGAGDRTPHGRFTPGPVAQAVVEHATAPVLVVLPGAPAANFRQIVCAVDHSEASRRALRNAIRLTSAFKARLIVLTVVPPVHWYDVTAAPSIPWFAGDKRPLAEEARARHEETWRDEFDAFLDGVDFGDVSWTTEVRTGSADEQILAAAKEHGADLVVMGSTGRGALIRALMGGVARRVLQALPCSLLSVGREDLLDERYADEVRTTNLLFAEGQELVTAKSFEAALVKLNQVLAHNPYHIPALDLRAEVCQRLGQKERAARCRLRADVLRNSLSAQHAEAR